MPTEWSIKSKVEETIPAEDRFQARLVVSGDGMHLYDAAGNLVNKVELPPSEMGPVSHPCDEECFAEVAERSYREGYAHGIAGMNPRF